MKRSGAVALAMTALLGLSLLGCDGGSDGSSPQPAPTSVTMPSTEPDASAANSRLSDDEIAGIEKELDEIDDLLDDLDAELRSD